jgi:hypothetical protein
MRMEREMKGLLKEEEQIEVNRRILGWLAKKKEARNG